jgi:AcrR family transcriptional regulator
VTETVGSSSKKTGVEGEKPQRTRDPERRQRILTAAAELFSRHGYHPVHLEDIGAEVGIVGSAIYRHFDGKVGILLEFFDRVVDRLIGDAEEVISRGEAPEETLRALVETQIRFTIDDRPVVQVYTTEWRSLPDPDLDRIRAKHRRYIAIWEDVLCRVRPELDPAVAEILVQAAINGIHSVLLYHPRVPKERLEGILRGIGARALGIDMW